MSGQILCFPLPCRPASCGELTAAQLQGSSLVEPGNGAHVDTAANIQDGQDAAKSMRRQPSRFSPMPCLSLLKTNMRYRPISKWAAHQWHFSIRSSAFCTCVMVSLIDWHFFSMPF